MKNLVNLHIKSIYKALNGYKRLCEAKKKPASLKDIWGTQERLKPWNRGSNYHYDYKFSLISSPLIINLFHFKKDFIEI